MTYTLNGLASVTLIAALVAGCSSYTTAQRPVVTRRHATTSVAVAHEAPTDLAAGWDSLGDVKIIGTGMPALSACEDHIVSEGRAVGAELAVVRPGSSGSECTATYYARRPPTTSGGTAPTQTQ